MKIKQQIPNLLTLGNLLCGCLAIQAFFNPIGVNCVGDERHYLIFTLMLLSLIFDFLDGMVARALKVSSPIGKELDSLADMVSFGVVPGLLMMEVIDISIANSGNWSNFYHLKFTGLLITLMSAYRLAKFNIDEDQSDKFKGVPTPFNTIFVWSLFAIIIDYNKIPILLEPISVLIITLLLSYLLVSNVPLLALKFKNLKWSENQAKYILLIMSVMLIIVFNLAAIPLIFPLYLIISFLHFKLKLL